MKKAMLLVMVLPALAMAGSTASVLSGGAASVSFQQGTVDVIPVEWVVNLNNADTTFALTGAMTIDGGADSAITIASITYDPIVQPWTASTRAGAGDTLDLLNEWGGIEGQGNLADTFPAVGTVTPATATLSGFAALPMGTYHLSMGQSNEFPFGGSTIWVTDSDLNPQLFDSISDLTVEITVPEPATMLLLAGGLALLRRRTA
jgi:hypothetical protein